jgi:hypothetical protein
MELKTEAKIGKVNISDIESISEKKSLWVSQKFSLWIFFWVISILIIWFFWIENIWWLSASLSDWVDWIDLHWSANWLISIGENVFSKIFWFLLILFFAIYILYIFAKIEWQKFWEDFSCDQKAFAARNFPSIYVLETLTMLYVITFVLVSFFIIKNINFELAFKSLNSSIEVSAIFALFWWGLSSLFYFLNKVRPWKFEEWKIQKKEVKIDFDINRVLKYLSFPFMSAWMWVVSFLIIMWIWDILWVDSLKEPSEYFIILLATWAWYFCDAFVILFHSVFKSIEAFLNKKISKHG